MTHLASSVVIGIGATIAMDIWGIARRQLLGVPRLDYALLGRWVGHMAHGRVHHDAIAAAPSIAGERVLGWISHYLIGISFAGVLVLAWGTPWLEHPSPGPALVVGIGTVAAPFLVMQPAMGLGIAASRASNPAAARLHSVVTHTVYGLGLYIAGLANHALFIAR